jgi:hypothetical protein
MSFFGVIFKYNRPNELTSIGFSTIEEAAYWTGQNLWMSHFCQAENKEAFMYSVVVVDGVGCAGSTKLVDFNFNGGGVIRVGDPWDITYKSAKIVKFGNFEFIKFVLGNESVYYHQIGFNIDDEKYLDYLEQLESGK